ncbi:MAG: thermonuclease family protein [Gammaproteobacteria bacterium]|nr:hypothetical protein [Rhodocyclaceae bacterium]MBU3910859.1 thermonuclease family protein [Gammaproteobacteria bacterium]MBU4006313.1 thermonuclease family protein [Gammaproteobacteria bacterium]MBU4097920.1 thermonuclease family protein [Gammaproteobacteria bacterium]MBU4148626.1 thermonuclease family protein [Gammaproteobacteria bacterium]
MIRLNILSPLLLVLLCHVAIAAPSILDGRVVGIQDGDTLTLIDAESIQHRIRLASIDAPEISHGSKKPGQPFGQRSKQTLSDLVYGREVRAVCETDDKYGRKVCTIMVGSLNANLEQVRLGMAMVYRKYARDQAYFAAEGEAKEARRGLWADPNPIPPWEWRHRSKQ